MLWNKKNSKNYADFEIDDAVLTVTEKDAAQIEWPINRRMLNVLWIFSVTILVVLFGRVFFLDVVKGKTYRDIAIQNSVRSLSLPAPRGIIYDHSGVPLVRNIPDISLVVIPADLPRDPAARTAIKEHLKQLFVWENDDWEKIFDALDVTLLVPIIIREHLTQEENLLFAVQEKTLTGLTLITSAEREYIDSTIFSPLLGYEGRIKQEELTAHPEYLPNDSIGKQGLEKSYESVLRGMRGGIDTEVTASGRSTRDLGIVPPRPGNDIILNIDAELQKKSYDVLQNMLQKQNLKSGALIAMDPRTGAVLALVSYPSFDNNLFSKGITTDQYSALINDPDKPLFNRAISGEYPPGSTFKPFVASAALTERTITESTTVLSTGSINIGSFVFHDWRVNGITDVRRALAVSSDIFFYAVGGGWGNVTGLGIDRIKKYADLFGFGSLTGIDIPSEAKGFIPDSAWKKNTLGERWYVGDDYHAAIGQGFVLSTPLQLVTALCSIANGGTLYAPQIVSAIRGSDSKTIPAQPSVIRKDFIDPYILQVVREGMRETVVDGTATQLNRDMPVEVAGKTGTAQYGGDNKTFGWFESFAPYDHPQIAMIVLAEGQDLEGYNAVPITKEIYQWYFSPDRQQ
ncbi:MAG: penicillin-binding protein 2 [Candidatus Moraniibacteriota bacterium]